jgi:hypothetical protein
VKSCRLIISVLCFFVLQGTGCYSQLRVTFSVDTVDMGNVQPCSIAKDSFWLENIGTLIIPSPASSTVLGFRVTAETFTNIVPGEKRKMFVEFTGNTSRPSYRTPYILNVNAGGENTSDTVWLLAKRLPGNCCVFTIDTIRGRAGEPSALVVRQDSTSLNVSIGDVEVLIDVTYNPTSLVPTRYSSSTVNIGNGSFSFRTTLNNSDTILYELPCIITLGNAAESPILANSMVLLNTDIVVSSYPSLCTVTDVCHSLRSRLFDPSVIFPVFSVSSHSGRILVTKNGSDASMHTVTMIDMRGRMVYSSILWLNGNLTATLPLEFSPALYTVLIDERYVIPVVVLP